MSVGDKSDYSSLTMRSGGTFGLTNPDNLWLINQMQLAERSATVGRAQEKSFGHLSV